MMLDLFLFPWLSGPRVKKDQETPKAKYGAWDKAGGRPNLSLEEALLYGCGDCSPALGRILS